MNFLIIKLYGLYKKSDLNPELKIRYYLALTLSLFFWTIMIPTIEIINLKIYPDKLKISKAYLIIIIAMIAYCSYMFVSKIFLPKNKLKMLEKKYEGRNISQLLLYLIVILLPATLLLLGPTLGIVLAGGEIFGTKISGLLRN